MSKFQKYLEMYNYDLNKVIPRITIEDERSFMQTIGMLSYVLFDFDSEEQYIWVYKVLLESIPELQYFIDFNIAPNKYYKASNKYYRTKEKYITTELSNIYNTFRSVNVKPKKIKGPILQFISSNWRIAECNYIEGRGTLCNSMCTTSALYACIQVCKTLKLSGYDYKFYYSHQGLELAVYDTKVKI